MIIANSVTLALYDYSDRANESSINKVIGILTDIFNGIFILECLLKVIAMGFIMHKKSYLRNGWNVIDFVVVVSAILETFSMSSSLSAIRSLRSIRPLRSINAIPSMRKLVRTFIISLPNLANVGGLLFFIIFLFGILGLH